jgi:hypothetical protein
VWAIALGLAAAPWRRRWPAPVGMGLATAGLLAAAVVASKVSDRRTEGRDAVRLVGRPALATPAWRITPSAVGVWGPADFGWGPAYEPHRYPDGAVLGGRLGLSPGPYRLGISGHDLGPQLPAPDLVVVPEPRGPARRTTLDRVDGGWTGAFEVLAGEKAVTLALHRGGPLVVQQLRAEASTFSDEHGLKDRRRGLVDTFGGGCQSESR